MEEEGGKTTVQSGFLAGGQRFCAVPAAVRLDFSPPRQPVPFRARQPDPCRGLALIALAMGALRARGRPEAGKDFAASTVLVKRGIYSVVRHPLYLGWLLMYPAAMLVSQHWPVILLGAAGAGSMLAICREADRELAGKFGASYAEYMREVPQLNLVAGIARKAARRKERENGQ